MVLNRSERTFGDRMETNAIMFGIIMGFQVIGAGINWAMKKIEKKNNKKGDMNNNKFKKGTILMSRVEENGKIFIEKKKLVSYDENGKPVWKLCERKQL